MILSLDEIANSKVEETRDSISFVRSGHVSEIPTLVNAPAGTYDPSVLITALSAPGMPQIGDQHPIRPEATVRRRLVFPTNSHNIARVEVHYGTPSDNGFTVLPNNQFRMVRDTTTMTQETTQLDGDDAPMILKYTWPDEKVDTRIFTTPKLTPLRTVVCYGTLSSKPTPIMLLAQGMVNKEPYLGFPRGYWFCSGLEISYPQAGLRFIAATFVSKMHRDWGSYGVFTDGSGRIPSDIKKEDNKALRDAAYSIGHDNTKNGLIKAGLYDMADIAQIFPLNGDPNA